MTSRTTAAAVSTRASMVLLLLVGGAMAESSSVSSPFSSSSIRTTKQNVGDATTTRTTSKINGQLDELPDTGNEWQTLSDGVEFQAAQNLSPLAEYHLRRLTQGNNKNRRNRWSSKTMQDLYYDNYFIDGTETYYDEYAQAWRLLGFYIDCDYCDDQATYCDRTYGGCQRFLLWAAYIDEKYEGGQVGEYAYYDRKKDSYDYSACKLTSSRRCVKMDCHESDTHFSLLGFFKEPAYDEWMEQLFKHEGDCVWTDDEYQFMQENRERWPNGCTFTGYYGYYTSSRGGQVPLYYDIKPLQYGEMSLGLYSDAKCIHEYTGTDVSIDQIFQDLFVKMEQDGDNRNEGQQQQRGDQDQGVSDIQQALKEWNSAFDVFKQCQPCKAYDLTNWVATSNYNSTGYRQQYGYYNNNNNNNGGGENHNDQNDGGFVCHDEAGYDDVNQCMKFRTKTKMMTATWRDIEQAGNQGTITNVHLPMKTSVADTQNDHTPKKGSQQGRSSFKHRGRDIILLWLNWTYFLFSCILLASSINSIFLAKEEAKERCRLRQSLFKKKGKAPSKEKPRPRHKGVIFNLKGVLG